MKALSRACLNNDGNFRLKNLYLVVQRRLNDKYKALTVYGVDEMERKLDDFFCVTKQGVSDKNAILRRSYLRGKLKFARRVCLPRLCFEPAELFTHDAPKLVVGKEAAEKDARMLKEHEKVGDHGQSFAFFK